MTRTSTRTDQIPRDVYYSIAIDQTKNLKERIAEMHGSDSEPMRAAYGLDCYVSDPQTRKSPWYWSFFKRVRSAMWALYPHAGDTVRTRMAREFMDDLFNGGYIRALQSLAVQSGAEHVRFARDYARDHSVPVAAVLLFGPRGGAALEFLHFFAAERVHGMHRHGTSPNPHWSEDARKTWYGAQRITNWPIVVDERGEEVPMDVAEEHGHLSDRAVEALREIWRRNPALRDYTGTNRLSGDVPYQIIEDVLDVLIRRRFSPLDEIQKTRYEKIVEDANRQGIDPFYAAYNSLFTHKDRWRPLWNMARKWLHGYSILLWEAQNELWLAEGKRVPASGVVYKPKRTAAPMVKKKGVPGTIYLNNGRYYWVVANKMKPRPLIDPKSKPKFPGTIFQDGNRYYWIIPGLLKRRRLVPRGEKFSAQDRAVAERIAYQMWNQLKKDDPKLAETILKRTRSQGLATKDRAVAEKIAARMWRRIKKNDPELAAKILTNNRRKAREHWDAQIVVNGKHRFIGSFQTQYEAEAAYAKEFEKVHGYPPGYNVQCIPKIDKVWPTWEEEKARLEQMNEHPRMPVIGRLTQVEALRPMIERMQTVDWVVNNVILVLDDNSLAATQDVAIQSRGEKWYGELKRRGKRAVICGSASLDRDTGRIRITVYNQGLDDKRVLAEEIHHISFKIIRYASPGTFEAIQRWYECQLGKGSDPTFSMPDVFSSNMAMEECGTRTSLPRQAVRRAIRIFSTRSDVPDSVMEQVRTNWSSSPNLLASKLSFTEDG